MVQHINVTSFNSMAYNRQMQMVVLNLSMLYFYNVSMLYLTRTIIHYSMLILLYRQSRLLQKTSVTWNQLSHLNCCQVANTSYILLNGIIPSLVSLTAYQSVPVYKSFHHRSFTFIWLPLIKAMFTGLCCPMSWQPVSEIMRSV